MGGTVWPGNFGRENRECKGLRMEGKGEIRDCRHLQGEHESREAGRIRTKAVGKDDGAEIEGWFSRLRKIFCLAIQSEKPRYNRVGNGVLAGGTAFVSFLGSHEFTRMGRNGNVPVWDQRKRRSNRYVHGAVFLLFVFLREEGTASFGHIGTGWPVGM